MKLPTAEQLIEALKDILHEDSDYMPIYIPVGMSCSLGYRGFYVAPRSKK